jgi:predicted DNA-binding transcriptional regulator AlpA
MATMEPPEIPVLGVPGHLRPLDIAALLGVTQQAATRITERPDFPPAAKVIGRCVYWRLADVERWRNTMLGPGLPFGDED